MYCDWEREVGMTENETGAIEENPRTLLFLTIFLVDHISYVNTMRSVTVAAQEGQGRGMNKWGKFRRLLRFQQDGKFHS